jgi:hypothetical protein
MIHRDKRRNFESNLIQHLCQMWTFPRPEPQDTTQQAIVQWNAISRC